jgi:PAS domain S-box-containing protein
LNVPDYKLLAEGSPGFIRQFSADGACEFCNETWLRFTGHALQQELGSGWARSLHDEDRERCVALVREHLRTRQPLELSFRLRRNDGRYVPVLERGVPLEGGGFLVSGLEANDRERLADLIAHELRTPVQAMQGFLEAARLRDPELAEQLGTQTERLSHFIGMLAQAEGGPAKLRLEAVDLAEVARAVVEQFSSRRRDRLLVYAEAGGPLPVRADRERLFRTLHDLLDNALKFSPGREEVSIKALRDGPRCCVQVIDHGIGVPAAEVPSLGRRWFRASNADPRMYAGLGLGLAIARETLRQHGGALRFESGEKRGMKAVLELPLA